MYVGGGHEESLAANAWIISAFTVFPWLWYLFALVPTQLPGWHTALLPSWHWKLFKHTSSHCPTKYGTQFPPGSRQCTCRLSALPNDTVPHRCGQDPYLRPLDPKLQAPTTAPQCPAYIWSMHSGTGTRRAVPAREHVLSSSFTSYSKSVRWYHHLHGQDTDTQSPRFERWDTNLYKPLL